MNLRTILRSCAPISLLLLVACSSPVPTVLPTVAPTAAPTIEPPTPAPTSAPTVVPTAVAMQRSFTPATYTDTQAGFALDYPAEWTLDPSSQIGVRGGQALLLSPGTTPETLADGGTRISIVTYLWDPKNDLPAYVTQRKTAWAASGFAINREATVELAGGRAAYIFIVQTPGQPSFTLLTTVGEDYLQISGDGEPALVEEIALTLRPAD